MSAHLKSYLFCQPVKSLEQPSEKENPRQSRVSVSHLAPQGLSVLQYFPLCQLPEENDRTELKPQADQGAAGPISYVGPDATREPTKAAPDLSPGSPSVGGKEETERTFAHGQHWADLQGTDLGTN